MSLSTPDFFGVDQACDRGCRLFWNWSCVQSPRQVLHSNTKPVIMPSHNKDAFGVNHANDRGLQIALKSIMLVIDPTWDFITETSAKYQYFRKMTSTYKLSEYIMPVIEDCKLLRSCFWSIQLGFSSPRQGLKTNTRFTKWLPQTSFWSRSCLWSRTADCVRLDHGLHHLNKCYIPISDHQTLLPT